MTHKMIVFWIIGSALLTVAIWILGNISLLAEDSMAYSLYLLISFVLILVSSLAWIAVATATAKH